jgi:hypothetical protein
MMGNLWHDCHYLLPNAGKFGILKTIPWQPAHFHIHKHSAGPERPVTDNHVVIVIAFAGFHRRDLGGQIHILGFRSTSSRRTRRRIVVFSTHLIVRGQRLQEFGESAVLVRSHKRAVLSKVERGLHCCAISSALNLWAQIGLRTT